MHREHPPVAWSAGWVNWRIVILRDFLTCRALLAPLGLADSMRWVVSPRWTRRKTDSSLLGAVKARRTAELYATLTVKSSWTRGTFLLT